MIRIYNQKECPVCGEIYDSSHNFCSNHDDRVKLVYTKDLVKVCPECGMKFTKDDNFCSQHEELIELVNIDDLVKQCRACGAKYPEDYNYCVRCDFDEPLEEIREPVKIKDIKTHPNKYYNFKQHSNNFEEIDELLSQSNIDKLTNFDLSESQFDEIITNIEDTYKEVLFELIETYRIDFDSLTPLEKLILFAKSFVKTEFKDGGRGLGHFEFNEIYIDDRPTDALQITTIIHELSHFLLAEILEQVVSLLLDSNKTDALEAFVCYKLIYSDFNYLVDEYCAHTVEGRFAIYGYQDYGSFKSILLNFLEDNSEEYVDIARQIGNTFALYIKKIMSSFIDDDLREDIKKEFLKLNEPPKYSDLKYETSDLLVWEGFSKAIKIILTESIEDINMNSESMDKLKKYKVNFGENNQES